MYSFSIVTVLLVLKLNNNLNQLYLYMLLITFWEDLQNITFNISLYYTTVNLLNSKANLIILMLVTLLINNIIYKNKFIFNLLPIIILLYSNNIFENTYLSYFSVSVIFKSINTNLLNGLMLVHPVILYTFYILYLTRFKANTETFFLKSKIPPFYLSKGMELLMAILIAIILGCWWAEQELSWGGWWSWDFVELLALNFFLKSLTEVHSSKNQFSLYYKSVIWLFMIFCTSVLLVRFNIINSIHNFVNSESQNQYFYYIIYVIVITLIFLIYVSLTSIDKRYNHRTNLIKIWNPHLLISTIIILFLVTILVNILIIDLWHFKNITQINLKHLYVYFILVYVSVIYLKISVYMNIYIVIIIYQAYLYGFLDCISIIIYLNIIKHFNKRTGFITAIHNNWILFYLVTLHQVYNFSTHLNSLKCNSILLLKLTNFNQSNLLDFNLNSFSSIYTNSFNKILLNNKYLFDKNITTFFKNIFEKNILLLGNKLDEIHNYDLQFLVEISSSSIFTILLTSIVMLSSFWWKNNSNRY